MPAPTMTRRRPVGGPGGGRAGAGAGAGMLRGLRWDEGLVEAKRCNLRVRWGGRLDETRVERWYGRRETDEGAPLAGLGSGTTEPGRVAPHIGAKLVTSPASARYIAGPSPTKHKQGD